MCATVAANIYQCDVTMRDTRRVTCLVYNGNLEAGMSCDWAHADGERQPMSTHTNEMKAFRLIREGMDDETIRIQTGYSKAVIQAMRKDVERIDHAHDHAHE